MLEAFILLPVSLLLGFSVFSYLVNSRWGGDWLWLTSWSERLGFYFWPRPPYNVVKLVMLNGTPVLLYNLPVKERKNSIEIETPLGILSSPDKGSTVLPLTSIYIPGIPNPMTLVVYAIAGLIFSWIFFYYGYLFLGLPTDSSFATLALVLMIYIYVYYNAAASNGVEYHSYEIRGLAPPYLHAVPSSEVVGPLKAAKYNNTSIIIRVTKSVKEALGNLKRALGVESTSEVAELLALGEFVDVIMKKATMLKVEATRVEETFGAFHNLRLAVGRITIGRAVLLLIVFIIGVAVGFALGGGGGLAIGPPPGAVHNATHVVHNATMGGGVP